MGPCVIYVFMYVCWWSTRFPYQIMLAQRLPLVEQELPVQLVPITNKVVSSNPVRGEVYSIQHYEFKFVSDLRQVCDFLRVLWFPHDIAEILLKVALNTKNQPINLNRNQIHTDSSMHPSL